MSDMTGEWEWTCFRCSSGARAYDLAEVLRFADHHATLCKEETEDE